MHTQAQIIERLIRAIPHTHQITDLDIDTEGSCVRFKWRGTHFRVTGNLDVDELEGSCLIGSDKAILLRQCLRMAGV